MESLNLPGILTPDFGLFFWMMIAFITLFVILAKFAFPTITKMVESRSNFINESLQNAHEANSKLASIRTEGENILREAREKQADILKEAMATRDSIVREAQVKAQAEGAKLLEEAKLQIEAEKQKALREIRSQVAALSVQIAEKVILQQLKDEAEQQKFIERILDETTK
ncbi:MAG: F0F1 ATP synthase subunit B [Bacteroidaceae bacterium]|nr:F0F1 ATP synthase subunit B [Bacteroidaceae bacterium]MBR5530852.1 F0F1 ATP synthase subunit B [Bacteroidaceae bacterium]